MIDGLRMIRRSGGICHPFTLAGAMAPVTITGAVTPSIAEALQRLPCFSMFNQAVPV